MTLFLIGFIIGLLLAAFAVLKLQARVNSLSKGVLEIESYSEKFIRFDHQYDAHMWKDSPNDQIIIYSEIH